MANLLSRPLCLTVLWMLFTAVPGASGQEAAPAWTPPAPPPGMPPGMAYYTVVMFERSGTPPPAGTDTRPIMQAHLAYMERLHGRGWLVGAGPIADKGDLRGIWILRGVSLDDTRRFADEDPTVKAGLVTPRVLAWWGPEGIGREYVAWRAANPDAPDRMRTYQFGLLVAGPSPRDAGPATQALQQQHLDHILGMVASGAVVAAGPFENGGEYRGILVFALDSLDAARALGEADPMVKVGRLALRLWPWLAAEGVLPVPAKAK